MTTGDSKSFTFSSIKVGNTVLLSPKSGVTVPLVIKLRRFDRYLVVQLPVCCGTGHLLS